MSLSKFIIKTGKSLDSDLRAIGFNLSVKKSSINPNIEAVLISASVEAVNCKDNRMAGLLVDWMSIHHSRLNADRLTKFVFSLNDFEYKFVKIFWQANAQRLYAKDQRFKRLSLYKGKRIDFADRFIKKGQNKLSKTLIEIKGEDERFKKTCIRVPKGYFSEREKQIFPATIIAKNHTSYRYRVMMGPSYRADLWALLDKESHLSAYALAKKACCSYRTAYMVKKDYELLKSCKTRVFIKEKSAKKANPVFKKPI